MTTTPTKHIRFDESGRAWIDGTTLSVATIVREHLAHGWSAAEISHQHYGKISLAKVYAALSYYYDYQSELDAQIEQEEREIDSLQAKAGDSPLVNRLRQSGQLP